MPKSMTGFGRATVETDQYYLNLELKSVNSRYFDLTIKSPGIFSAWEGDWRRQIQNKITRGKLELKVSFYQISSTVPEIFIDQAKLQAYATAYRQVYSLLGEEAKNLAPDLLKRGDIFTISEALTDADELQAAFNTALDSCLEDFDRMRSAEAEHLTQDLLRRLDHMEELRQQVAARAATVPEAYRKKLLARVDELLGLDQEEFYDGQRVAAEVAIYADKADVAEELVRLAAHIKQFRKTLDQTAPCGKKLDFIVQEMNREANTLASKAQDLEMVQAAVELKSQIEQLREQIQNLE
ncbi:MAG: YicC/YloC family endoribonuclease [Eubacteriales bacterium]|nr:YicC/YloC family endoribonuclease [Eubacteriales bacterium]